jgi:hypothetical protein
MRLEESLRTIAEEISSAEVRWGASTLVSDGVVVRGLAREAHQIAAGMRRFWAESKDFIWGRPAILPRKIH